jgi:hypothetical protein
MATARVTATTGKHLLDVVIVYNKTFGLTKDAELLQKYLGAAAKAQGRSIGKVKHVDPREVPVMCDIIIHLEIPYYAWFPYARYNIVMVNPEWWVSEAFDPYLPKIDLLLFKNEATLETFKIMGSLPAEKIALVPWCCDDVSDLVRGSDPKRAFLYLLAGSPSKAAAAKDIISLWKPSYPNLHVYTTRADFAEASASAASGKENVKIIETELSVAATKTLQASYFGHICASEAEGFGLSAAEAENIGCFTILNHNESYDASYTPSEAVWFLPTTQVANDKTRSSRYVIGQDQAVTDMLDKAVTAFATSDVVTVAAMVRQRREDAERRRHQFAIACDEVFKRAAAVVDASRSATPTRHIPPPLSKEECPHISIVTLVYNRRKFWDLALHNMMVTDYPRDKMEWVIVDDSDDMEQSISDKIAKITNVLPDLNVAYVPYHEKITIGGKRNLGTKRAKHDIILMMDDDDHYPETSFRRRVSWLVKTDAQAAVCTTLALYDLRTGISAVNVPPYDLPLGKRLSEATLTFRRSFFNDRKFEKISMAEGDPFVSGRESQVVEMMPQQIIVSFCHGSNSSSRRIPPSDVKPACFWGFPPEFLQFVHKLADVDLELVDLPTPGSAVSSRAST